MKIAMIVLLGVSLAANAVWLLRPEKKTNTSDEPVVVIKAESPAVSYPDQIGRLVQSGDPAALAKLKELGLPDHLARALILAHVADLFEERSKALRPDWKKLPYWANDKARMAMWNASRSAEALKLERERLALLKQLLGPDYAPPSRLRDARYYPLPAGKAQLVQMIEEDYNSMKQEFNSGGGFAQVTFPEDQEKLAYLEKEQRAELAALLTPEELFEYDVRHSPDAMQLRHQLQAMKADEREFRELFRLQQSLLAALGPDRQSQEYYERRYKTLKAAEPQYQALLGEERFKEYQRAQDFDSRRLQQIADRLQLPADQLERAYTIKAAAETKLAAVRKNPDARDPAKRAALMAILAQETEVELAAVLGTEGVEAYKQHGGFFRRFQPPTR